MHTIPCIGWLFIKLVYGREPEFMGLYEPLSTIKDSYVNYESAVNPEYFDKTRKYKNQSPYGIPVIHRKLGLSTPNERIVYEAWMKRELDVFMDVLKSYICIQEKGCNRKDGFKGYLTKLKDENELKQERFLQVLSDPEFLEACENMVEIYDKYFDSGYCQYDKLKSTRNEISELREKIVFENKSKLKEIIDLVSNIETGVVNYLKKCK